MFGAIGNLFNLANFRNFLNSLDNLNNLNNPDNSNNPQNPKNRCSLQNLGSALQGLRSGTEKCKRKYDNKKCTIREKAKPKEEKPEPPPTQPTDSPTEAPKETTTTEKPSSCTATCSAVQNPDHGARIGDKTSCGDSVSFSCEKEYKLQGCAEPQCKITCQHDGQWSNQPPKCIKTTCGGLVTLSASNRKGEVEKTSDHTDCNWAITSEKPSEILLRFSVFNLPSSVSEKRTCQDYVEIIVGARRDRFCGARPDDVITITNAGMVRFHSSSSSQAHFKIELTLQTGCSSSIGIFRRGPPACNSDCTPSANGKDQWPSHVSVITTEDSLNVKLPNNNGVLKFIHGEKAIARCTGSKFTNFVDTDKMILECKNGKFDVTYTDAGGDTKTKYRQKFKDLGCHALPKPELWKDAISNKIHIGWVKDKLTQITIEYDNAKKVPVYAEHIVRGSSIFWSQKAQRPDFKNSRTLKGINEVEKDAYKKKLQYKRFEEIDLGLGKKYIDCCDANFLVRGHLAPNADFSLRSWRDATFFMVNVAPQWQGIDGNFDSIKHLLIKSEGYTGKDRSNRVLAVLTE